MNAFGVLGVAGFAGCFLLPLVCREEEEEDVAVDEVDEEEEEDDAVDEVDAGVDEAETEEIGAVAGAEATDGDKACENSGREAEKLGESVEFEEDIEFGWT